MSHAPYIMPDGRPLGQFLHETQEENFGRRRKSGSTKKSRKADKYDQTTWDSQPPSNAVTGDELDSGKLGRDRRRRYLNEKILRDMAGAMTAADMEALFKPVPFGATDHESLLSRVTIPSDFPVWDLFRNVDEERQTSTLQKWESAAKSHKRGRQDEAGQAKDPVALAALRQWSSVPKKAREAMKRCPEVVETLELPVMEFLEKDLSQDGDDETDCLLQLELDDAYQRLLTHGIATYYKLHSRTDSAGTTFIGKSRQTMPASASQRQISCSDICFAISQDSPGVGLTASALYTYWKRMHYGTDAESEASYIMV